MTGLAPGRVAQRRPAVALVGGGAVVLVLAALPVDPHRVSAAEAAVFRALNGVDVLPFALVWPVMQLGNLLVVPAAALLAAALCAAGGWPPACSSAARRPTCWRRW